MSEKRSGEILVVVEEAFAARGPGVLLRPRIALPSLVSRTPFAVAIAMPDGRIRETTAIFEVPHVSGPLPPLALLRLPELSEADVPPGCEVRRI